QKIEALLQSRFNKKSKLVYNIEDNINLKSIDFSVNKYSYHIDFNSFDTEKENQKIQSLVQTVDKNQISRNSYRNLAIYEPNLPQEWAISNRKNKITKNINQVIKMIYVDLNNRRTLDYSKIDSDTVKISEIGIQKSAKDLLIYLISQLEKKGILYSSNPTIHLRISGDGRNTGSKVKHVMIIVMILNDISNHYYVDHHYTTVLYSSIEKYDVLNFILKPFLNDLQILKDKGLDIMGTYWDFKLYSSTD
ncbi:2686_t:CDS:1, partial [Racocetra fulgida]